MRAQPHKIMIIISIEYSKSIKLAWTRTIKNKS